MPRPKIGREPTLEEAFAALQKIAAASSGAGRKGGHGGVDPVVAVPQVAGRPPEPPIANLVVDEEGWIRHADVGAAGVFRCELHEMVGVRVAIFVVGDPPAPNARLGVTCRRRDGTTFPASLSTSQFRGASEVLTLWTVRDDDAMAAVEAERQESHLRFRGLVEQMPAVTFTAALQGGPMEIYVSPQIEELLGYSQQEWVSNPVLWYERLHPEDRGKLDAEFARGCMTGGPFRAECRFIARDGSVVWVHGEARLISDARRGPLFLQGVAFNVTDIRRLHEEQAARAAVEREHYREKLLSEVSVALAQAFAGEIRFQTITDLLAPGYCDWCITDSLQGDVPRRVAVSHGPRSARFFVDAVWNRIPAWTLSSGQPGRPIPPRPMLLDQASASNVDPEGAAILQAVGGRSLLMLPLHAGDRLFGVLSLVNVGPDRAFGEEDLRFGTQLAERIATLLDNARLYQEAQEAFQARDALVTELERAVHFSKLFVGVLGHDLRNPLGSIMMAASLLERRCDDESVAGPVGRILSSAERMRRMIDQILDFTHIRLGRGLPVEPQQTDLLVICETVLDELLGERVSVDVQLSARGDATGLWDPDRLGQLFSNLISNALQHRSTKAPIHVLLDGTDRDQVELEVCNQGAIPPKLLPRVFDPLQTTGDGAKKSGSSGLGLGLFISREIARGHGGRIDVTSGEAEGTCFTLRLPRRAPPGGAVVGGNDRAATTERAAK